MLGSGKSVQSSEFNSKYIGEWTSDRHLSKMSMWNQNTTLKWRQVSNIKSTMVGFWLDFGWILVV